MGRLAERAQRVFSDKAAKHGTPIQLSDREGTVSLFPEPVPPGHAEYLPDGPGNAADATQWLFYGSAQDFPAPPVCGHDAASERQDVILYRQARPQPLEGLTIYWTLFAYQQPTDDAATNPDAADARDCPR